MNNSKLDFMQKALDLARQGIGCVLPNPLVGCVVVKDNRIVGQGFHRKFGGAHAEVNAIRDAGQRARGATLFVTLEPCCHHGKTPPCTSTIIQAGIKKVVIADLDPNPEVCGKGIEKLRSAGIDVECGILQAKAHHMNRAFNKYILKTEPYVTLKIAQTLDGRIADTDFKSKWISSKQSRDLVHRMRYEAGAVLVGSGTVITDDPQLNVRTFAVKEQPWRIVIDPDLRSPQKSKLFCDEAMNRTVFFTNPVAARSDKGRQMADNGIQIIACKKSKSARFDWQEVLQSLGKLGIAHILVEGGNRIFSSFLHQKICDELQVFIAPKIFAEGLPGLQFSGLTAAQPLVFGDSSWQQIGPDMLFTGYPSHK